MKSPWPTTTFIQNRVGTFNDLKSDAESTSSIWDDQIHDESNSTKLKDIKNGNSDHHDDGEGFGHETQKVTRSKQAAAGLLNFCKTIYWQHFSVYILAAWFLRHNFIGIKYSALQWKTFSWDFYLGYKIFFLYTIIFPDNF